MDCAILGLWAFTNLEMAYAQLRVDERARAYMFASGANVAMTVMFTVALVVFADQRRAGLLLGNFGASAIVVLGLWWAAAAALLAARALADLRAMLRFGLPTVPADASVYALQVVDRLYLFRVYSARAAGEYSIALQLATVVFVLVRGFQYAWPPLAYSIESDGEASRLYSLVTTYYVLATGYGGLRRGAARPLAGAPAGGLGILRRLQGAAVAGARLGAVRALSGADGAGGSRGKTTRNFPAAAAGLTVNVALLLLARARGRRQPGHRGSGPRAVRRLRGDAHLLMHLLTRSLFHVAFDWPRLALLVAIFAGVAVSGELLLPTSGLGGLVLRTCGWRWPRPVGPHALLHRPGAARRVGSRAFGAFPLRAAASMTNEIAIQGDRAVDFRTSVRL